jgi:hypothetical protein
MPFHNEERHLCVEPFLNDCIKYLSTILSLLKKFQATCLVLFLLKHQYNPAEITNAPPLS